MGSGRVSDVGRPVGKLDPKFDQRQLEVGRGTEADVVHGHLYRLLVRFLGATVSGVAAPPGHGGAGYRPQLKGPDLRARGRHRNLNQRRPPARLEQRLHGATADLIEDRVHSFRVRHGRERLLGELGELVEESVDRHEVLALQATNHGEVQQPAVAEHALDWRPAIGTNEWTLAHVGVPEWQGLHKFVAHVVLLVHSIETEVTIEIRSRVEVTTSQKEDGVIVNVVVFVG